MKYIVLLFVVGAIIGRLWYNFRVSSGTSKLARGLKKGKLDPESFQETFDILLAQLSYKESPAGFNGFENITSDKDIKYEGKIKIEATGVTGKNKAAIIATVTSKRDTQYSNDSMDILLPCNLLIVNDEENKVLSYYSECPADKEHEFLIKDFINQVHYKLI